MRKSKRERHCLQTNIYLIQTCISLCIDSIYLVSILVCNNVLVCVLSRFSHVWLFATLWTVARQAPPSKGFSRQEYWSEQPFLPPRDLPDPGTEPVSLYVSCIGSWVLYHQRHLGSQIMSLHRKNNACLTYFLSPSTNPVPDTRQELSNLR